jgi:hypothetical protein
MTRSGFPLLLYDFITDRSFKYGPHPVQAITLMIDEGSSCRDTEARS